MKMKSKLLFFYLLIFNFYFLSSCQTNKPQEALKETLAEEVTIESVLAQISEPTIPSNAINLTDFGGVGDSATNNQPAFAKAIEELKNKGGGKLIVPAGKYIVNGPIHLISNMDLHLEEEATLLFGSDAKDYLPVVKTSWEGTFLYNYSPFIYALECENVAITGEGTIDGEASETWNTWRDKQKEDQLLSREMNHTNVPIEKRVFGEGHFLRPQLIQFFDCKNVKVEGVTIEDSPFWCVHLLRCENVIVRGVKYNAFNKNNDGIDPEYSRNVLIEDVQFNNSDDNVAVKAGRDDEGRASEVRSENIVVRNCHFKGLHAMVIGSEMSAGVQNVFVEDCTFAGYLKRGIYLKSNPDRGGFMKNIRVKNVDFGLVEDCIYITSFYHNEGEGHATEISDIYFENIHCNRATNNGIVIQGFPEMKVRDIHFTNVQIDTAKNAMSMTDTENIIVSDLLIGEPANPPSAVK
ncbi:glycoside hydrolase family 28 protein [Flammeovirgaceae bacterium SG7u.111]|nr:glycoside hydrolase family 28 protein [Flammeovirgaceae bacterium SG7u.132]WPO37289.1 glycoside hydrolase family 28 protein [Flammeovirgaceae bacterium SG7u.111]